MSHWERKESFSRKIVFRNHETGSERNLNAIRCANGVRRSEISRNKTLKFTVDSMCTQRCTNLYTLIPARNGVRKRDAILDTRIHIIRKTPCSWHSLYVYAKVWSTSEINNDLKEYMIVGSLHMTCDWQYTPCHELWAWYSASSRDSRASSRHENCVVHEYWTFFTRFVYVLFPFSFRCCPVLWPLYPQFTVAWLLREHYTRLLPVCCQPRDCCLFFSLSSLSFLFLYLFLLFVTLPHRVPFLLLPLLLFSSDPSERVAKIGKRKWGEILPNIYK